MSAVFALDTPAIAGQRAARPHHPVTGDCHRQPVIRAGAGDRTNGARLPDLRRDFGIGGRLARRDLLQSVPDALLKGRAAHVERQLKPARGLLDKADDLRDPALEFGIGSNQPGIWERALKAVNQCLRIVAELNGADPFLRRGDKDAPKRTLTDREADRLARPAFGKTLRPNAEPGCDLFIKAAGGAIAGGVNGVGHVRAIGHLVEHAPGAVRFRIGARRQSPSPP